MLLICRWNVFVSVSIIWSCYNTRHSLDNPSKSIGFSWEPNRGCGSSIWSACGVGSGGFGGAEGWEAGLSVPLWPGGSNNMMKTMVSVRNKVLRVTTGLEPITFFFGPNESQSPCQLGFFCMIVLIDYSFARLVKGVQVQTPWMLLLCRCVDCDFNLVQCNHLILHNKCIKLTKLNSHF